MDKDVRVIIKRNHPGTNKTYAKREIKRSSLSPLEKKAYGCWGTQRERCTNVKHRHYSYYGGKGTKVIYTRKQLIDWVVANYKGPEDEIKDIVIGRIDHDGNYEFGNIQIETRSQGSFESYYRTKPFSKARALDRKKVGLFSKNNHECIAIFSSIIECGKFFDRNYSAIGKACAHPRPKGSMKNSWYFRFVKDEFGTIMN